MKIAVVTDSGSAINQLGIEMDGLYVLPLQLSDGRQNYKEGVDITNDQCYQKMYLKERMTSSLPPIGLIEELFLKLKENYEYVYAVPLSPGLSSTYQTMEMVASQLELPYKALDCFAMANNQLYSAVTARKLFDEGRSVDEVHQLLQDSVKNSLTLIIPDDLMHLARNGRTTPLAATIGGLLNIRPVLYLNEVTQGRIDVLDKVRTESKALMRLVKAFKEMGVNEQYEICVAHAWAEEKAQKLYNLFKEHFPDTAIYKTELIGSCGVNTGLNCVACQAIKKVSY